ncbi:MAG: PD40 domain-containing protein [Acidobacteria bacterium]|nr:PD40 domain-containing protein [Acidobacteriota bacterium]
MDGCVPAPGWGQTRPPSLHFSVARLFRGGDSLSGGTSVSCRLSLRTLLGFTLALLLLAPLVSAQTRLLRFPDIHGDKVVFAYAGDLWVASTSGGAARRLTAHPGVELFAKFSPDGKWIAFIGQYDGDEQVYVIPTEGGEPKQLTFYPARGPLPARWGYDNQIYGWTPDGKSVLFRSLRDSFELGHSRLYTVPVEGGPAVALPMPQSGAGDFSPDARKLAYSPLFRDFRTWKRYQGGWAQDLYIYDLASNTAQQITNHPRADRDPMWIGDKIFYSSDHDGTNNLYSYDIASKQTRQLTRNKTWDVRWPSSDNQGLIVYEIDGELHLYDTKKDQDRKISINVPDDGLNRRPSRVSAASLIEDFELSPKGERALFVARGDVFTAPIEKGPTRNLTDSSSAHDKWARWSPDGRKIAFVSDITGEDEIYLINQDGSGKPERITSGGQAMRYAPEWAPDGKRLAFSDKDGKLYILTLDDKKLAEIADEARGQLRDYSWSADGGHLAFSLSNNNNTRSLYIWSAADAQVRRITNDLFSQAGPVWDPDGNYLFYASAREYAPMIGSNEFNYALSRNQGLFAVALRKDVKHPFPAESDEVTLAPDADAPKPAAPGGAPGFSPASVPATSTPASQEAKPGASSKEEPKKKEYLKIDFDGLADRVSRVPVDADNFFGLTAIKGHLVYARGGGFYYGRESDRPNTLFVFSIKDRKETTVAERINGYAVSADGSKVLVRSAQEFKLYDLPVRGQPQPKTVSTRGLMVDRVPAEEWAQIFDEVWRRYRDFFYVKNMHGYDWKALHDQYKPLLQYVGHRSDLNYVLGEMVSELNVSHAYIAGGDWQIPERPRVALPGARFALDSASGRYKIAKIFRGQNEEERYRSPLTEVGVDVKEGDFVLAVDAEELKAGVDPYRLLVNKADRPVTLTVNSKPTLDGARKVSYRPITSESDLIYLDWVTSNREKVEKATGGRVGYLHIPDMGASGIREFIKWFYPQIRKEGLVIDVRGNGGGNVSQMLIERLRRTLLATGYSRTNEDTSTYPGTVFYGHLVCLLNETSASDGDIFPNMFRRAGLGPLIGKRSWGGVIGITDRGPLIDGGSVNVPEFGNADANGKWDVENYGVDPDIVVENDPRAVIEGRDPQLERGVEEVMKRIKENPKKLPPRPADPVKTK